MPKLRALKHRNLLTTHASRQADRAGARIIRVIKKKYSIRRKK